MIAKETGMAAPRQVLKFQGKELPSDEKTVKDMGIRNGSALIVEIYKVPITVLGVLHAGALVGILLLLDFCFRCCFFLIFCLTFGCGFFHLIATLIPLLQQPNAAPATEYIILNKLYGSNQEQL
jgi:hypothetical protein